MLLSQVNVLSLQRYIKHLCTLKLIERPTLAVELTTAFIRSGDFARQNNFNKNPLIPY